MVMRLVWTERFNRSWEYLFTCAKDYLSQRILRQFNKDEKRVESLLLDNPKMGAIEPMLAKRDFEYRFVYIRPFFKVIYTILDDTIVMVDLWDTRRNPQILTEGIA